MAAMELQPIRNAPASPGTGVLLALQRDGVPAEDAPKVKELQTLLAADIETYGDAALADATTLLRFLRAREHDVAAAATMEDALANTGEAKPKESLMKMADRVARWSRC